MMRMSLTASLIALLCLAPQSAAEPTPQTRPEITTRVDEPSAVRGRLLVSFKDPSTNDAARWIRQTKARPVAESLLPNLYQVDLPDLAGETDLAPAVTDILDDVDYIHPDYHLFTASIPPTDANFGAQWALEATAPPPVNPVADIEAIGAWKFHTGTGKTLVAVIDTGVAIDAHDLEGRLWKSGAGIGKDLITSGPVTLDDNGHGTRVATIIGARANDRRKVSMVGINWKCRLMPLRVFKNTPIKGTLQSAAPISRIIAALSFAGNNDARVVNNSYGARSIHKASALRDAFRELERKGILCICAAGNGDLDLSGGDSFYPASFDLENMIVVTSTNRADLIPHHKRATGATVVDLAAPGEKIFARANYGYGEDSGTSYAAAHVSGAAALVWDFRPDWTFKEVKKAILVSVRKAPQFQGLVGSGGALNLEKLMVVAAK